MAKWNIQIELPRDPIGDMEAATKRYTDTLVGTRAPLNNPDFTGAPTAPTPGPSDNSTRISTTAHTLAAIAANAPTRTGGGASGSWGIAITGNAASATRADRLTTAREITLSGGVTGSAAFDGTGNLNIVTAVNAASHNHNDQYTSIAATNLGHVGDRSGNSTTNTAAAWASLPVGYSSFMSNVIGTAGGAPAAIHGFFTKIANRDMAGGWAGLWASYSGGRDAYLGQASASNAFATWDKLWTSANFNPTSKLDTTATAAAATKLATARTITLTGHASGSTSFDGSANVNLNVTIPQVDVTDFVTKSTDQVMTGAKTLEGTAHLIGKQGLGTSNAPALSGFFLESLQESTIHKAVTNPLWVNDLAFLTQRGGSVTTNITGYASGHPCLFDTSSGFIPVSQAGDSTIVVNFPSPEIGTFIAGIHFGDAIYRAGYIGIDVQLAAGGAWINASVISGNLQHKYVIEGVVPQAFSAIRFRLNNWAGAAGRVYKIWIQGRSSQHLGTHMLSRAGGSLYGDLRLETLTGNRTLELDANRQIVSVAKATGHNLALGTTAGTVAEGNHSHTFASLSAKPTTLAGYGITDAPTKAGTGASGTWDIGIYGNAATASTATKLATPRTIGLTGLVTATGVEFDGSLNITLATAMADNALSISKVNGLQTALNNAANNLPTHNHAIDGITGLTAALAAKVGAGDNTTFTGNNTFNTDIGMLRGLKLSPEVGNVSYLHAAEKNLLTTTNQFIKLVTPLAPGQGNIMFRIHVQGMDYTARQAIDFSVIGYLTNAGTSIGNYGISNGSGYARMVRLALEDRGSGPQIVLILGSESEVGVSNQAWTHQKMSASMSCWRVSGSTFTPANWDSSQFSWVQEATYPVETWITPDLNLANIDPRTGIITGVSFTGLAARATQLATARSIALTGNVTGSATFNGTANISINATVAANSHAHTIANVTGLQTALDAKAALADALVLKTAIPSGADLNTYQTTGLWHQAGTAAAAAGTNYPVALAGLLSVVNQSSMTYQYYHVYNSSDVWVRSRYTTTWTPWRKQITSAEFDTSNFALKNAVNTFDSTGTQTIRSNNTQLKLEAVGKSFNSLIEYYAIGGSIFAGMGNPGVFSVGGQADLTIFPWFSVTPGGAEVSGYQVWHAGNLNPNNFVSAGADLWLTGVSLGQAANTGVRLNSADGDNATLAIRVGQGTGPLPYKYATLGQEGLRLVSQGMSYYTTAGEVFHPGNFNPGTKANVDDLISDGNGITIYGLPAGVGRGYTYAYWHDESSSFIWRGHAESGAVLDSMNFRVRGRLEELDAVSGNIYNPIRRLINGTLEVVSNMNAQNTTDSGMYVTGLAPTGGPSSNRQHYLHMRRSTSSGEAQISVDEVSGQLAVRTRGSSGWNAWHQYYHTGNYTVAAGVVADSVAQRDSSGDLNARTLRTSLANEQNISGAMAFRINNGADDYLRFCNNSDAVRNWLGVGPGQFPTFQSIHANSWDARNSQGAYLQWNRSGGGGESVFVNHRGLGAGGFRWLDTADGLATAECATLSRTGVFRAPDVGNSSDRRLKRAIETLEYKGRLTPRIYEMSIKGWQKEMGFVTDEVKDKYPELVVVDEMDKDQHEVLLYGRVSAVLSAQANHTEDRVMVLEEENCYLKEEVATLRSTLADVLARLARLESK